MAVAFDQTSSRPGTSNFFPPNSHSPIVGWPAGRTCNNHSEWIT
jgi:hypothetical protein